MKRARNDAPDRAWRASHPAGQRGPQGARSRRGSWPTTLTATGLPPERAYRRGPGRGVAASRQGPDREVGVDELQRRWWRRCSARRRASATSSATGKWNRLAREDRPVIVLIGGATGVGKSTIAAQVADRLGVVRIISTDSDPGGDAGLLLGEPHAGDPLLVVRRGRGGADARWAEHLDPHVVGFMEQVEMVNVGVSRPDRPGDQGAHQPGGGGRAHGARHAGSAGAGSAWPTPSSCRWWWR